MFEIIALIFASMAFIIAVHNFLKIAFSFDILTQISAFIAIFSSSGDE